VPESCLQTWRVSLRGRIEPTRTVTREVEVGHMWFG
jgi:hypothetical protein